MDAPVPQITVQFTNEIAEYLVDVDFLCDLMFSVGRARGILWGRPFSSCLVKLGVSQSNVQSDAGHLTCEQGCVWRGVVSCLGRRMIELLAATTTFSVVCHRPR